MKKMFLKILVVLIIIGIFAWPQLSVFATTDEASATEAVESADETPKDDASGYTEDTTDQGTSATQTLEDQTVSDKIFDYYDDTLSVDELYCNIDDVAEFPAVIFGESTEEPMLASYVNDPNWGDHRQFARMGPARLDDDLTAGDCVAKIILQPDQEYCLMEYLVNTAVEGGQEITGLKLFIDFPDRMRAGETNYVYAYLNSDNDAGGSRVCRVQMVCNDEIWLRPVGKSLMGVRHRDDDQPTFFTEWKLGATNYQNELRYTLEIEWPEDFNIQGGVDNGYFGMVMLETFSENPAKNVIYATEENADELIADTEYTEGYEEYVPDEDESVEPKKSNQILLGFGVILLAFSGIIAQGLIKFAGCRKTKK